MKEHRYTIIVTPEADGGAYNVTVPALPGCVTYGETIEEAVEMAKEAIAGYLEALRKQGEPIPEETEHPQAIVISVAA